MEHKIMASIEHWQQKADDLFNSGYNCAESLSLTLAEFLGMKTDIFPRLATGFGGGLARNQELCGAVAGAVLGLGLKFGRNQASESREPLYRQVQLFLDDFRAKFGTLSCRKLTGVDFSDAQYMAALAANWERLQREICTPIVRHAVACALLRLED
jgi:C_GCAxxG_C_C family probable redox protein